MGRVPHVRPSVHGPKKMGEALPLLFYLLRRNRAGTSTISFSPVTHANDRDGLFDWLLEEDAVVAAAEAEATLRRFKLLHVSVPSAEIAVDTVQNIDRRLAIDGAKISACLGRPENRETRRIRFGHYSPNSRRTS